MSFFLAEQAATFILWIGKGYLTIFDFTHKDHVFANGFMVVMRKWALVGGDYAVNRLFQVFQRGPDFWPFGCARLNHGGDQYECGIVPLCGRNAGWNLRCFVGIFVCTDKGCPVVIVKGFDKRLWHARAFCIFIGVFDEVGQGKRPTANHGNFPANFCLAVGYRRQFRADGVTKQGFCTGGSGALERCGHVGGAQRKIFNDDGFELAFGKFCNQLLAAQIAIGGCVVKNCKIFEFSTFNGLAYDHPRLDVVTCSVSENVIVRVFWWHELPRNVAPCGNVVDDRDFGVLIEFLCCQGYAGVGKA